MKPATLPYRDRIQFISSFTEIPEHHQIPDEEEEAKRHLRKERGLVTGGEHMAKLVLIIDDLCIMLDLVEYMLQMAGYEVMTVSDALTALAQIETTSPDLILLDVMMPHMSGYDFIEQLRQRHHAIPIVLLTVKEHTPEEVEHLGVAGYLRKPFHHSELLNLLHELLSDPQQRNARI